MFATTAELVVESITTAVLESNPAMVFSYRSMSRANSLDSLLKKLGGRGKIKRTDSS